MTYVRLVDDFFDNAKARAMGRNGRALYLAGLCHCGRQETDGFIAASVVALLAFKAEVPERATVATLLACGAWVPVDDGYAINDYLEHQRSKDEIGRARASSRASTAAHNRRRKAAADAALTLSVTGQQAVTAHVSDGLLTATEAEAEAEAERVQAPNGFMSPALHVLPNETKTNTRTPARKAAT